MLAQTNPVKPTTTATSSRRVLAASAIALAALMALPVLPSGFSSDAQPFGAAFAKHGADDGPNDNGHHAGGGRHNGKDDGVNHDANDDHPGKHRNRGGR